MNMTQRHTGAGAQSHKSGCFTCEVHLASSSLMMFHTEMCLFMMLSAFLPSSGLEQYCSKETGKCSAAQEKVALFSILTTPDQQLTCGIVSVCVLQALRAETALICGCSV